MNTETEFLIRIVKEAEKLTRQSYEVHQKDDRGDLVTSLDLAVENYLIREINKNYPDFDIVSEEFHPDGAVTNNCFIIDPIDGTINFANGMPIWGIQAACRKNGSTVASVIDLPDLNEFYYADRIGAYRNGEKIRVKEVPIKNAVYLLMGKNTLPYIENMCCYSRNFRNFGAACAAFAFMASGRIHGVTFQKETPWDYEPGLFLCRMAGAETENKTGFHAVGMNREFLNLLEKETARNPVP